MAPAVGPSSVRTFTCGRPPSEITVMTQAPAVLSRRTSAATARRAYRTVGSAAVVPSGSPRVSTRVVIPAAVSRAAAASSSAFSVGWW